MDLIFWRHAEAEDWTEGCDDMQRSLTARGEKQAKRMAGWLDRQLPEGTRIICSPARRCEQTVLALGRKYKLRDELAPDATAEGVLAAAGWPNGKSVMLLVGHQPALGQSIALLLGMQQDSCPVRKGSVWWIRTRERDGDVQTVVVTVQAPELL
ncbi:SixA phosphatase family protein [Variovorax arabinosiphilus]|jgi:phosphohistidine phosphatase|uniref:SixA phosphatase family protein n=1 Tax=Variovorax arabinosiphilus TaxID=3053498 RepID=UPI0025765A62|nr:MULTISPECIES: histidine phosphatase family protein [unclassified Variovorax]MDM0118227.1 histidine phosphatase family protein [Variovorax sp. J2L1-78]MDM0128652.1 histidine phosphatase family protein [Variovorax sp. J2L1-63]MDM0233562.1 histidine phosphatase family protein [Variovorax sp. J2R1-6]